MPRLIEDWKWAVMTIRQEADSEPFIGKVAVAEVIRNRTASKYNSDGTVIGTILRPLQFSGWNTSDPNRIRIARIDLDDKNTHDALAAWELAQKGSDYVRGANLYHTKALHPEWADKVEKITEIGNHIFYIERR